MITLLSTPLLVYTAPSNVTATVRLVNTSTSAVSVSLEAGSTVLLDNASLSGEGISEYTIDLVAAQKVTAVGSPDVTCAVFVSNVDVTDAPVAAPLFDATIRALVAKFQAADLRVLTAAEKTALLELFLKTPQFKRTTANAPTTSLSLVDIPNLSVPLEAGGFYEIKILLAVQSSSTAGNAYGIGYTGTGVIEAQAHGSLTTAAAKPPQRISAFNAATSAFVTYNGVGSVLIQGVVIATTAGTLTVKQAKITSGTATALLNSFIKVTKAN